MGSSDYCSLKVGDVYVGSGLYLPRESPDPAAIPTANLRAKSGTMSMALSDMVSFGDSQRSTKGEDFFASVLSDASGRGFFGVFDSHGGRDAGQLCSQELPDHLLNLEHQHVCGHDAYPDEAIADAFWKMDHRLGVAQILSGSTATVLLVSTASGKSNAATEVATNGDKASESASLKISKAKVGAPWLVHDADTGSSSNCAPQPDAEPASAAASTLCCTLAWVGDSTAICVDMVSEDRTPIQLHTNDHSPTSSDEAARCELEWKVRREANRLRDERLNGWGGDAGGGDDEIGGGGNANESFMLLQSSETFYARRRAPSREDVCAAVANLKLALGADALDLLVRALGREKRMEAPERRRSFAQATPGSNGAVAVGSGPGSPPLLRQQTSVLNRVSKHDSSVHGPKVLVGGEHGQVSTCVTRSIGDWDGARAMIPQPDVARFDVAPDQHSRVVIASDGVWDLLTAADAAALARKAKTPKAAALRIVELANERSLRRFERLKDDTTCVVVDLNPSQLPIAPPVGGGGCCSMM